MTIVVLKLDIQLYLQYDIHGNRARFGPKLQFMEIGPDSALNSNSWNRTQLGPKFQLSGFAYHQFSIYTIYVSYSTNNTLTLINDRFSVSHTIS